MGDFAEDIPVYYASSPGRLDVMGGIADYSGSLLLQMPVKQTTTISLQKRTDNKIKIKSETGKNDSRFFLIDYETIRDKELKKAGKIIHSLPGGDWASYIIGCFLILQKKKRLSTAGATIHISSTIPIGKGVSSSAALEVATMHAICKAYNLSINSTELAILAQQVENIVVGAPCGLMDQLTVELGQKKKLLPLICQPCTVMEPVHFPPKIRFCGIDSGIRHAVSGASYSDVRAAAFMGFTIIAKHMGISLEELQEAKNNNNRMHLPYKGYLANISVNDFENKYEKLLPDLISGKDFIQSFGISIDEATVIDPEKAYQVKRCVAHPVFENYRVNSFLKQLTEFSKSPDKISTLIHLGELMYQSHTGYSSIGLGNNNTDEIVNMIKDAGTASGVYGARVTGGGSGGTVVILCFGKEGKQTAKEIYMQYRAKYRKKIFFFYGSSQGASILNNSD